MRNLKMKTSICLIRALKKSDQLQLQLRQGRTQPIQRAGRIQESQVRQILVLKRAYKSKQLVKKSWINIHKSILNHSSMVKSSFSWATEHFIHSSKDQKLD